MKAVVVIVEGLGAAMLGPYGSATSTTPAINRLAARSLVLDQCFIDSFELATQLRSLWTAMHASCSQTLNWTLWHWLAEHDVPAQLITDSEEAAQVAQEYGCGEVMLIDVDPVEEPALAAEDCKLMHVFAAAMDVLTNPGADGLVWIHAKGLRHSWDAPLELRQAMTDPEDPEPPAVVEIPDICVDETTDPDLIVGWGQVAAAQVAVLDEAIDALQQTLAARSDNEEWAWLLSSTGGIPLGEHGCIGRALHEGYAEEIAVPAIIRPSEMPPIGTRRAELCQLPDLPITLLAAMGFKDLPNEALWGRCMWQAGPPRASTAWPADFTLAWLEHNESLWMRTPAWSFVKTAVGSLRLFVKPDDRWEVSDIAGRRDDIIDQLQTLLPEVRAATNQASRTALPVLEAMLTSLHR